MATIYEKLKAYSDSDYYGFHMPGHKRNKALLGIELPYDLDITEIDGFDDLHHADGILKEEQERAARVFGAEESHFLVNGSTAGILSAVMGCTHRGDKILVARHCHKSIYHAIYMNGLVPRYVYPEFDISMHMNGEISKEDVAKALAAEPDIKAVVIVSPNYDGVVSDVKGIAEVAHSYRIPLIVDEAHGAHFIYHEAFPESAVSTGADIVIQSLHKTLPAMTQTGLLHLCTDCVSKEMMQKKLSIFQSSSPSYVLMSSIEQCIHICDGNRGYFQQYCERLWILREKLEKLQHIQLVRTDDIGKLVFSVKNTMISGEKLFEILRDHLEMEMSELYYVIAMTSICDTQEGYDRLYEAMTEIDQMIDLEKKQNKNHIQNNFKKMNFHKNRKAMKPEEATRRKRCQIDYKQAEGMIAAEFVFLYPPGIPLVVPGEVIDDHAIHKISQYEQNDMKVIGLDNHKIYIIDERI